MTKRIKMKNVREMMVYLLVVVAVEAKIVMVTMMMAAVKVIVAKVPNKAS